MILPSIDDIYYIIDILYFGSFLEVFLNPLRILLKKLSTCIYDFFGINPLFSIEDEQKALLYIGERLKLLASKNSHFKNILIRYLSNLNIGNQSGSNCKIEQNVQDNQNNQNVQDNQITVLPYDKILENVYVSKETYINYDENYQFKNSKYVIKRKIDIRSINLSRFVAYISMYEDDKSINYKISVRGTTSILELLSQFIIVPDYSSIFINNKNFLFEMYQGIYTSVLTKKNKFLDSPIDIIFRELFSLINNTNCGDKKCNLTFTGHSLGACQINILFFHFFSDKMKYQYDISKIDNIEVFIFGCPKITKDVGCKILFEYIMKNFNNIKYYSFVNDQDIISHIYLPIFGETFHISNNQYLIETMTNKIYVINSDIIDCGIIYSLISLFPKIIYSPLSLFLYFEILIKSFLLTLHHHIITRYVNIISNIIGNKNKN